LARTHRFATIQNVTDDRQTDRRQTTYCTIGSTDSTVGQKQESDVSRYYWISFFTEHKLFGCAIVY